MKPWLAIPLLFTGPALAADFPQPVRVADLIGQKLIAPRESQPLLGHVEAIDRLPDGDLAVRVQIWGLIPLGTRSVDVPIAAVSFLGPQLALTGISESQLGALPAAQAATPLAPDTIIRVGLVKPFH
jgi:hypothetical protein